MLSFFRKYQKIFFFFVTIIIVSSFVFFGTFQAIAPIFDSKETPLFKTSDNRKITQSYLNDMARFLAQEPLSMQGFQNFLNDHVVSKEFLDTKIGYLLVQENFDKIQEEWSAKFGKERAFRLYKHPLKNELCAENVWLSFAKPLYVAWAKHMQSSDVVNLENFEHRAQLFLMERRFPGDILSYILRYEEKQNPELGQDPKLRDSLALFGYRDLNDWFGSTYIENAAKAIIRGAAFARTQGYQVSKEEMVADIVTKCDNAFKHYKQHTQRWPNSQALYQDCLKMLQIDEMRLMTIMEDILLFRRLFQDVSGVNLVDTFAMKCFFEKAHECVELEIVTLPGEYVFKKSDDLKKFEVYLESIAGSRSDLLSLPDTFDSIEDIEKRAEHIVASVFIVDLASITKKECEAKVSLKDTWSWQESHRSVWRKQFPEITSLDALSGEQRAELDSFARKKIVESHPEWISDALASKKAEEKRLVLPKTQLEGISDTVKLVQLLADQEKLSGYTQDGEHYYTIVVKERLKKELLTFKEARDLNILDKMVKAKDDKGFDKIFDAIYDYAKKHNLATQYSQEDLASLRFAKYMNEVKEKPDCEKALWPLPKKRQEIFRHSKSVISFDEAMDHPDRSVAVSETIGPFFTRFIDRRVENPLPLDKMMMEEKLLSDEIKTQLLAQILMNK